MKPIFRFWNELKRRNIPKGIISYVIFSWVVLQVISVLGSLVDMPTWAGKTALTTLLIFFPIWIVFSWFYDITKDGIKRTSNEKGEINEAHSLAIGKKLNIFILATLSVAVVLLVIDRFRLQKNNTEHQTEIAINSPIENSIVVLPLTDLSPNKDHEYFADGLAEELLNSLTRVSDLKVTSRTSAFSFKNKPTDIPTIAKKLGVNYILEGSVRSSDSMLRISLQLIDSRKDKSIWSQSWDRKMVNIFEIQNSIAQLVTSNMEVSLVNKNIFDGPQTDPEAYALYLEARYFYQKNIDEVKNLKHAQELLMKSFKIDSTYAPSWELLSSVLRLRQTVDFNTENFYDQSETAARKSIELDPNYALGYSALSNILLEKDWDFIGARQQIEKALALEPNNAQIIDNAAGVALAFGEIEKSVELNERSVVLDPVSMQSQFNLGLGYYYNGQLDKAEASLKKSLELQADQFTAHYILSLIYLEQDKLEEALSIIEKEPFDGWKDQIKAMVYWKQGDKTKASVHLNELVTTFENEMDYQMAQVYAYRGDIDKTYEWLDKAYETRNFGLVEMQHDPLFKEIKSDPRWNAFLKKMQLIE